MTRTSVDVTHVKVLHDDRAILYIANFSESRDLDRFVRGSDFVVRMLRTDRTHASAENSNSEGVHLLLGCSLTLTKTQHRLLSDKKNLRIMMTLNAYSTARPSF